MLLAASDPYFPQFMLWFLALITVFTLMSLASLRRSESEWSKTKLKLEDQVVSQQHDLIRAREEAAAWRLETQRQFDAFRADASKQLSDAEQRTALVQQHLDDTLSRSWKTESDLRQSLDQALQLATAASVVPEPEAEAPVVAEPTEPETAVVDDSLEPLQTALAASEQKAAALEQALTLERFRSRRALAKAKAKS